MTESKKKLLVEGFSDGAFFQSLLSYMLNEKKQQQVKPKSFENHDLAINAITIEPKRGKDHIISNVVSDELKNIQQQKTTHLGVVLDADYPTSDNGLQGRGYADTKQRVEQIIVGSGYEKFERVKDSSGWVAKNPDKDFCDIGLWIMPNNHDDGMLEDFIISNLKAEYAAFMQEAQQIINDKEKQDYTGKFIKNHKAKAQIGTWKAWYHKPDDNISCDKVDTTTNEVQSLITWLKEVFELKKQTQMQQPS